MDNGGTAFATQKNHIVRGQRRQFGGFLFYKFSLMIVLSENHLFCAKIAYASRSVAVDRTSRQRIAM